MRVHAALVCAVVLSAGVAYGNGPPDFHVDVADYPKKDTNSNGVCKVTISHEHLWDVMSNPPRNNHPHEKSLYPGDYVGGLFTRTAEGCCNVRSSGPTAVGSWSELVDVSGGSYTQKMKVLHATPTPTATAVGGYIHTAEYDSAGRDRTHWHGTLEGYGQTTGAKASITGGRPGEIPGTCVDYVTARITTEFVYRNPFWETSIYEHHVLDANGYPASNLDYSQYPHDAIPLEAGSNLVLGAYRHETIKITHEILSGGKAASKSECTSKTCSINLPPADSVAGSYVGNDRYQGDAKNPPWDGPNGGVDGELDRGEAMFAIPATASGEIRILSIMKNDGVEVARGYNSTYQFVPSYDPVFDTTIVSNTALGGGTALDRPVSVIVKYNGTVSDTLHYCTMGDAYDTDGTLLPRGTTGGADKWKRVAGDRCPETDRSDRTKNNDPIKWGIQPPRCADSPCKTYTAHPEKPASTGWGRWTAVNPETRALLHGFTGEHRIECPPDSGYHDIPVDNYLDDGWERVDGEDVLKRGDETLQITVESGRDVVREYTECFDEGNGVMLDEAAYATPYLNWDFVPGTERKFIPACVADAIAAEGGDYTNKPKPENWGMDGSWWPSVKRMNDAEDGAYEIDKVTAERHSYRGLFAAWPHNSPAVQLNPPAHYVVDSGKCEQDLGDRECVPRGSECRPEYDRRCESVFEPFLYPDDYIMAGHERLQEIVVDWCGPSPSDGCALDAYEVIDEVMVSMCKKWNVVYEGHNQVIDAQTVIGVKSSPNACHNMITSGLYAPVIDRDAADGDVVDISAADGGVVDDWRACYGDVPEASDPPAVWPDGKPNVEPQCVMGYYGDGLLSLPNWDGDGHNIYVPYTPSTGAFGGVVERPGNMLMDDGSLTCGCPDDDGDSICDYTETEHLMDYLPEGLLEGVPDNILNGEPADLAEYLKGIADIDGNGILDGWDPLTPDGAMKCLDRTGTAATAALSCWAAYGLDAAEGDGKDLKACLGAIDHSQDGPDGECDPAVIVGTIVDGKVDDEGLPENWKDTIKKGSNGNILSVPFSEVDGLISIPYVVDGDHPYCDSEDPETPWCISSGDTYVRHEQRQVCEGPDSMLSVKRIPAPATMPPLYQPVFDAEWPPRCLPEYPVAAWERPDHDESLDVVPTDEEWPTMPPNIAGMDPRRTPAHVSTYAAPAADDGAAAASGGADADPAGPPHTMLMHAGEGVIRFGASGGEPPLTGAGMWVGAITSSMGNGERAVRLEMDHAPFILDQNGTARVIAVEPCDDCENGWRPMESDPGIGLVVTAYPRMDNPATRASEMVAHGCQIDGDRGTGLLNAGSQTAQSIANWASWVPGIDIANKIAVIIIDLWHGMTCRDIPGISVTVQDYEAARGGVAAKRESGQPWTVAEGENDVSVQVFRNGLWISTLSILEHRGQCTSYSWSQGVTPGHTSCPDTAGMVSQCIAETGDIGKCMDDITADGACAAVFVEDNIHKKWEFSEAERNRTVEYRDDIASYADYDAERDGNIVELVKRSGTSTVDTVYRLPDGSYSETLPEAGSGDEAVDEAVDEAAAEEAAAAYEAYMETLRWTPGGGPGLLRCEAMVGEDGAKYGLVTGMSAEEADFMQGGSYACEGVQACKQTVTTYKCLGGKVVPNVTCEEPEDTFSILDMPYEEVMSYTAIQNIHVAAVCPTHIADNHAHPTERCDGQPIYDTHVFDDVTDHATIYVDYFGVGELQAGRGDARSRTVVLTAPETFGNVHSISVERDGSARSVEIDKPCTVCVVEHPGAGIIHAYNIYGGKLSVEVEARSFIDSVADTEDLWGVLWLYLPLILAIVAAYIVIRRFHRQLDIWDGLRG